MSQIKIGHFEADGNAYNLILGFIPDYIRIINTAAADTEVAVIEWFKEMGDDVDIQWNNSDAGEQNFVYNSSGGYIDEYDTTVIGNRQSCTFDYTGGTVEDMISCTSHGFVNGEKVKFIDGGDIAVGLDEETNYYVINSHTDYFQVSLTLGGSAVEMSDDGSGTNYVFSVDNLPALVGGKGVTIDASFMDDGDEIYYQAWEVDKDEDIGDVA